MNDYTQAEAGKEMRAYAKALGLTFKIQPDLKINNANANANANAYMFIDRKTGERVLQNCTFWSAYENSVANDHLATLVK